MTNRTFMLIKPDSVSNGYVGAILDIIIRNGFRLDAMRLLRIQRSVAEELYQMHRNKQFYDNLIEYITSDGVVAAVLEKSNAVEELRRLTGDTNPAKAAAGTLRHRFGYDVVHNAVHASDSEDNVWREARLFFAESDYLNSERSCLEQYIP